MKDAGYRSFPNYLSAVKDLHVTCGHPWHDTLAAAATHASASTQRGIGPAHQCGEIKLEDALAACGEDVEPLVPEGPGDCANMFVMTYFHILRGMEIIMANAADITIDYAAASESWKLSVSKTDPQAIGCVRTWGCVCPRHGVAPCPVHAAIRHCEWLRSCFAGDDGVLPGDLPLFPSITGGRITALKLSATVEAVAAHHGLPLTDEMGRSAYSEHVFRVSGSRMLARAGIPTDIIMLMARWSSEIIRRYVGEVPLATLTERFINRASGTDVLTAVATSPTGSSPASRASATSCISATAGTDSGVRGMSSSDSRLRELETHLQLLTSEIHPPYVQNGRSKVVHDCGPFNRLASPHLWRTPCGWPFGAEGAIATWTPTLQGIAADLICGSCLADARASALLNASGHL